MKNIYKKILPLFGASCSFLPNQGQENFNWIKKHENSIIQAKLDKTFSKEKILERVDNQELKNFLKELNKTEIYLLVTTFTQEQEKMGKQVLLLLHTEDRLNSEQSLINYRHLQFLFSSSNSREIGPNKQPVYKKALVNPKIFSLIAKTFRSGKSYYVKNIGGYKSICPVFFDKSSAEDFLIQTSKEALALIKTLPIKSNKEVLKGFLNTKILSVGLGDFIENYSLEKNQIYLEKTEFLFVPCLQKEKPISKEIEKRINDIAKNKSFKEYQNLYYQLKSKN